MYLSNSHSLLFSFLIPSYLKLYTTMPIVKLAAFLDMVS